MMTTAFLMRADTIATGCRQCSLRSPLAHLLLLLPLFLLLPSPLFTEHEAAVAHAAKRFPRAPVISPRSLGRLKSQLVNRTEWHLPTPVNPWPRFKPPSRSLPATWHVPTPGTTFYWQLSESDPDVAGSIDTSDPAQMYDVDGSLVPASTIAALKAAGKTVVCYFSFGTAENFRSDYKKFPRKALGGVVCQDEVASGCTSVWQGERWVNVRMKKVRQIMHARIKMARAKGCDGIEPDNINAHSQKINVRAISHFKISRSDQIKYNKWIARTVHKYNMSVGYKNPDCLAPSLFGSLYDWALSEQCNQYSDWSSGEWYSGKYECDCANEWIVRNKAVFVAEYTNYWGTAANSDTGVQFPQAICADNNAHGFTTHLYNLDVGAAKFPFADCLPHRPGACAPWKECVKEFEYSKFKQSGMPRWEQVGQCVRSRVPECAYQDR